MKRDGHQIYLDSKRNWRQPILNWILKIDKQLKALKKWDGYQIYLDSKGGIGFFCQEKKLVLLMKLDLMNRLRRACEARNVLELSIQKC